MQADAPDPQSTSTRELWRVPFGRLSLVIGDPRGTLIDDRADRDEATTDEDRPRGDGQHAAQQTRLASLERAVARASSATDKLGQVVNFIARLLQMRLDAKSLEEDADNVIETARRHSREERWDEVLELARAFAMLLALLERWEELLQSLQLSIQAAERLGDVAAEAWGHHELGTVHLLRGESAKADRSLALARKLREQIGDWDGLAATDFNLQVLCRGLRAELHGGHSWPPRRPLVTVGLAVLMLVVGGAVGVAIGHTGSLKQASDHPTSVGITLSPDIPRAEQPVAFHAILDGHALASSYHWQFGDGSHSSLVNPSHLYHYPGHYLATVTVATAMSEGTQVARATRTVIVAGAKPEETLQHFTTPEPRRTPVVVTLAASAVTATDANLNGTLNPNDTAIKSCYFQYGIGSYEHSAQCSPQPSNGSSPIGVSASHLNLTPNTLYNFRLVAANASGQTSGEPQTFTTLEAKSETTRPTETTGTESSSTSTLSETTPTPADTASSTTPRNPSQLQKSRP